MSNERLWNQLHWGQVHKWVMNVHWSVKQHEEQNRKTSFTEVSTVLSTFVPFLCITHFFIMFFSALIASESFMKLRFLFYWAENDVSDVRGFKVFVSCIFRFSDSVKVLLCRSCTEFLIMLDWVHEQSDLDERKLSDCSLNLITCIIMSLCILLIFISSFEYLLS